MEDSQETHDPTSEDAEESDDQSSDDPEDVDEQVLEEVHEKKTRRNIATFVTMLLLIAGWTVLFMYTDPEDVIAWIGVNNSYLVAFFISVLGALGSVTPFSTYPAVYAMAPTEVNAFLLVPIVAAGLTLGDAIFFYFGVTAQSVVPKWLEPKIARLWDWLKDKPDIVIQIVVFIWVGFLPLANNLLTAPLALAGYRFRKVVIPLALGNCSLPIAASYLAIINA